MSTQRAQPLIRSEPLAPTPTRPLADRLPFHPGDHLTRAEFERRYEAHPEIKKAELIGGVVYISSPVPVYGHARPHAMIVGWLGVYRAATPGVVGGASPSLRLDYDNEPQPDAVLCLEPSLGGRSRVSADDYLEGSPELIVEVAASSAAYDLHAKLHAYQRHGVQEYLAALMYEQQVRWFALREGVYEPLAPDESGMLRSEVFPGLWLQPAHLFAGELAALLAMLNQGLATPEHAAFVQRLSAAHDKI